MSVLYRLRASRRAATLVEFALLSPILIMLLTGILAYGQYLLTAHSVQQLANDAARSAIVGQTSSERRTLAQATVVQQAAREEVASPAAISTLVEEASGQIMVTVVVDTRGEALLRTPLVPLPDPIIRRRAVAQVADLS